MPAEHPHAPESTREPLESLAAAVRGSRPFLLLLALVGNLVLAPVIDAPWLRLAMQAAIILAAASLAADTPVHRRVTAALATPALALLIAGERVGSRNLEWTAYFFLLGLYVLSTHQWSFW